MKRWLFSYWPPLLILLFAVALLVHDSAFRRAFYASGDRVGPLGTWGESYQAAWTAPEPAELPLVARDGDLHSSLWDPRILNTVHSEEDAIVFDDLVVFASNRGATQDFDLYWARRVGSGFTTPVAFPAPINTAFNERSPSLAFVDGEWLLAFVSNRTYGTVADHDVFTVRGTFPHESAEAQDGVWGEVQLVDTLSSSADERAVAIRPDGSSLYITRPARFGCAIYESWRQPFGGWTAPEELKSLAHQRNAPELAIAEGGTELYIARSVPSVAAPNRIDEPDGIDEPGRIDEIARTEEPNGIEEPGGVDGLKGIEGVAAIDGTEFVRSRLQLLRRVPGPPLFQGPLWWILLIAALLLALRALARQWPTLEIIYRCLLLSAIIHLLLWLWLRDKGVESDPSQLQGPGESTATPIEFALELFESDEPATEVAHGENVSAEVAQVSEPDAWRPLDAAWESLSPSAVQLAHADAAAAPASESQRARAQLRKQERSEVARPAVELERAQLATVEHALTQRHEKAQPEASQRAATEVAVSTPSSASTTTSVEAVATPEPAEWQAETVAASDAAPQVESQRDSARATSSQLTAEVPERAVARVETEALAEATEAGPTRAERAVATVRGAPTLDAKRRELDIEESNSESDARQSRAASAELAAVETRVTQPQSLRRATPTERPSSVRAVPTRTTAVESERRALAAAETQAPSRTEQRAEPASAAVEVAAQPLVRSGGAPAATEQTTKADTSVELAAVEAANEPVAVAPRRSAVVPVRPRITRRAESTESSAEESAIARKMPVDEDDRKLREERAVDSPSAPAPEIAATAKPRPSEATPRPVPAAKRDTDGNPTSASAKLEEAELPELAAASRPPMPSIAAKPTLRPRLRPTVRPQSNRARERAPALVQRGSPRSTAKSVEQSALSSRGVALRAERVANAPAPAIGSLFALAPRILSKLLPERRRLRPTIPKLESIETETLIVQVERVARSVEAPTVPWLSARFGSRKEEALRRFGGDADTERAVQRGLAYLASRQRSDGSWGSLRDEDSKYGEVVIGKSALVVLAFLGAGHFPGSDTKYEQVAKRGLDFLMKQQKARTGHFGSETTAYSHGIATYAIAEACLLRETAEMKRSLVDAVGQILRNQIREARDSRLNGGWSYYYHRGPRAGVTGYPRVSITAWQLMALKSAALAGIEIPRQTFELAERYLVHSWSDTMGRFLYSLDEQRLRSRFPTLPGSTPAAAFVMQVMGRRADDPVLAGAFDYIGRHVPDGWRETGADGFVRGNGNPYYWYYGTLAMFLRGGPAWDRWNRALKETLLPSQLEDGSWPQISIYASYAADTDDNRSYTTALNVLMLEVYYRYLTPFQEAALGAGGQAEPRGESGSRRRERSRRP